MREVLFDAENMNNEISHLEEENQIIKQMINKTFFSLSELDTQWEGPAKEAARAKFVKDQELLTEISNVVEDLIHSMQESLKDYKKTDKEVKDLVESI